MQPLGCAQIIRLDYQGTDYEFRVTTVQLGIAKYTRVELEGAILTHYPGVLDARAAAKRAFEGYVK